VQHISTKIVSQQERYPGFFHEKYNDLYWYGNSPTCHGNETFSKAIATIKGNARMKHRSQYLDALRANRVYSVHLVRRDALLGGFYEWNECRVGAIQQIVAVFGKICSAKSAGLVGWTSLGTSCLWLLLTLVSSIQTTRLLPQPLRVEILDAVTIAHCCCACDSTWRSTTLQLIDFVAFESV
jgi:hypothetical protein